MYQKLILVGNLGRDPEMRYTPDGRAVTNFSIATNEVWNDADGEKQERTTWWRISAWGRLAEVTNEYLSKGRQVLVEGRVNPDQETGGPRVYTRTDGTAGASFEVTALTVKFLGSRQDNGGSQDAPAEDEDSIPF